MRHSSLIVGAVLCAVSLSGCGTFGQKVNLSVAEAQSRCEDRGGTFVPSGRKTGEVRRDYTCSGVEMAYSGNRNGLARTQLNAAVDQSLRTGF